MIHFSYSFCMAMLHSMWQAALLLLFYVITFRLLHKNNNPLINRNVLYAALLLQTVFSLLTFCFYYFNSITISGISTISTFLYSYIKPEGILIAAPWIFSAYSFIILFKTLKTVYAWQQFKNKVNTALIKPPVHLKVFTAEKSFQFGIKKKVTLFLSNTIHTPVTFGFLKPIILLPVALVNNITIQQAETLILHELTHIQTNDYILNWFLLSIEALFFFNPFIRKICKKIRLEREKYCDISVIAFEYNPGLYAETLLQTERMKQSTPAFQMAAVNDKKQLLKRIIYFTNKGVLDKIAPKNIIAPVIGFMLIFLLVIVFLYKTGNYTLPLHSAKFVPYLPISNYSITDADYGKIIINNPVQNKAPQSKPELINNVEKEKKTKQIAKINIPKKIIQQTYDSTTHDYFVTPVATKENDAGRQIIIREEGSDGITLKYYYLSFEDNKWVLRPQLIMNAKQIPDSLIHLPDSLKRQ